MLGLLGIKAKTRTKVLAVFVIGFLVIASIALSSYFFNQKQKAEKYQTLVDKGVISQGEDVILENYDEKNLSLWTSGGGSGASSGSGGGGSGGGGEGSGAEATASEETIYDIPITFYGVWTTEDNSGNVGGQDEAS